MDRTAKYLFGENYVIDYDKLEMSGYYTYLAEYGLAYRWGLVKEALAPIVLGYEEFDDHFLVLTVFLTSSTMLPAEYDYYYFDKADDTQYEKISGENARAFCYGNKPDKYTIRVDKGEDDRIYLRSVLVSA